MMGEEDKIKNEYTNEIVDSNEIADDIFVLEIQM